MYEKVEYYYSSKVKPVGKFPCDDERVFELLSRLEALGTEVLRVDVEELEEDVFPLYHKATTGSHARIRSIFGEFRMFLYQDMFGRKLRALLFYERADDETPFDVFPRMHEKIKGVRLVEEALEEYVAEQERGVAVAMDALKRLSGEAAG